MRCGGDVDRVRLRGALSRPTACRRTRAPSIRLLTSPLSLLLYQSSQGLQRKYIHATTLLHATMSSTTNDSGSLGNALLAKVGLAAPAAPALPTSFDYTPKTTPPLSPTLAATSLPDEQLLLASQLLDSAEDAPVALNGFRLTLGEVVAAARHNKAVKIDGAEEIKNRIDESVAFLKSKVSVGRRSADRSEFARRDEI